MGSRFAALAAGMNAEHNADESGEPEGQENGPEGYIGFRQVDGRGDAVTEQQADHAIATGQQYHPTGRSECRIRP